MQDTTEHCLGQCEASISRLERFKNRSYSICGGRNSEEDLLVIKLVYFFLDQI